MCKQMDISCPFSWFLKWKGPKEIRSDTDVLPQKLNFRMEVGEANLRILCQQTMYPFFICFHCWASSRSTYSILFPSTANGSFSKLEWFKVKPFQSTFSTEEYVTWFERSKLSGKERVQLSYIVVSISNENIEFLESVLI